LQSAVWLALHNNKIGAMKKELSLEEQNARLRGDLLTVASRVSHDLRTPLGGIITATEVLREILAGQKESLPLTKAILDSVDDMTRLIKQISFVTRATAQPSPKEPVHMGKIVSETLQRLESRILKKNATIVEPASWPQINGVEVWLEAIWENFLTNALQYTSRNPRIEISWHEENSFCRFAISDNGGGVPEHIRRGLFQPFHLLYKPDGAKGLGLSIVQRLVELQGGSCGYEPISGGSLFFFSLPSN
jgi:signal transduction histidine kinase